jgi:hypothetical protein
VGCGHRRGTKLRAERIPVRAIGHTLRHPHPLNFHSCVGLRSPLFARRVFEDVGRPLACGVVPSGRKTSLASGPTHQFVSARRQGLLHPESGGAGHARRDTKGCVAPVPPPGKGSARPLAEHRNSFVLRGLELNGTLSRRPRERPAGVSRWPFGGAHAAMPWNDTIWLDAACPSSHPVADRAGHHVPDHAKQAVRRRTKPEAEQFSQSTKRGGEELGVPDLSPEEVTERARRRAANRLRPA